MLGDALAKPWSDDGTLWERRFFLIHQYLGLSTIAIAAVWLALVRQVHGPLIAHLAPWTTKGGRNRLLAEMKHVGTCLRARDLPLPANVFSLAAAVKGLGVLSLLGFMSTGAMMVMVGPATDLAHSIGEVHEVFFLPLKIFLALHVLAGLGHLALRHPLFADAGKTAADKRD